MNAIENFEREHLRMDIPAFKPGDTVKVNFKIQEGDKERIQVFEGVVIRKRKGNLRGTFTVRKISYRIGVERIFPLHSPFIDKIEVVSQGRVRRSRLYYLRGRKGKTARIKEQRQQ
jgi:large subunit ribosomal protein L19